MKTVAKNQNVFFTNSCPMMLSRKLCRLSTSHSQKFCAPLGTVLTFRVAICAKMITARATIQQTSIEFVTENFPIWKRGTALRESVSCSASSAASINDGAARMPIAQRAISVLRNQWRYENIECVCSKRKPDLPGGRPAVTVSRSTLGACRAYQSLFSADDKLFRRYTFDQRRWQCHLSQPRFARHTPVTHFFVNPFQFANRRFLIEIPLHCLAGRGTKTRIYFR